MVLFTPSFRDTLVNLHCLHFTQKNIRITNINLSIGSFLDEPLDYSSTYYKHGRLKCIMVVKNSRKEPSLSISNYSAYFKMSPNIEVRFIRLYLIAFLSAGAMGYISRINGLGDAEGNFSLVARSIHADDKDQFGMYPVGVFRLNENLTALPVSTGPGCSKLPMSLVNVSLKFQTLLSEICQYCLLKKCVKLLHCKSFSHIFNKNVSVIGYKVVKHLTS